MEFGEALAVLCDGSDANSLGFVFTPDDTLCGIDLDDVRDLETGKVEAWAQEIVDTLASYTEISISGEGLHIICHASLPEGRGRRFSRDALIDAGLIGPRDPGHGSLEIYDRARYFITTGIELPGGYRPIEKCQKQINALLSRFGQ
jgi:primase-polymerase (primpol)-like protein